MTAKIKLNAASGGGSFSLQAPSSSSNNRVMTLPDTADGTILTTTNPKTGNIVQVVANNINGTSSVSFSGNNISSSTPVTATITSTIANSKFIVSCVTNGEATIEDHEVRFILRRTIGGTATSINVGNADGVKHVVSSVMSLGYYNNDQDSTPSTNSIGPFLDSPSQAAGTAITYGMFIMSRSSGTFYYGRTKGDDNQDYTERLPNNVTIMEVAP